MRGLIVTGMVGILAGCAVGIQPGKEYPSETFTVPVNYQEAYRRADAQARECLDSGLTTTGTLYTDNKTGIVRTAAAGLYGGESMNTKVAEHSGRTEVTVTVWGVGLFDQAQIDAVRKSVETGKAVCRVSNYQKHQ